MCVLYMIYTVQKSVNLVLSVEFILVSYYFTLLELSEEWRGFQASD